VTEEQLTGILSTAMNGSVGDALRQWLERKRQYQESLMYDAEHSPARGVAEYEVGRMSMLFEIRKGLDTMKNAYQILSEEKE